MTLLRRTGAALATIAVVGALAACTPTTSTVISGSSVTIAVTDSFTSLNPHARLSATPGNLQIAAIANSAFGTFDAEGNWVADESFGTVELVDDDPLTVTYSVTPTATWSDGAPVDAVDLLLNWAALSGSLNTDGFDVAEFIDPETGGYSATYPDDVVYFDTHSDAGWGITLATQLPEVSADRTSITIVYDEPFADWRTQFTSAGVPAHVIGQDALGIEGVQQAKEAILEAIEQGDTAALAEISAFWNSGFTVDGPISESDPPVTNGPYVISSAIADQYVRFAVSPDYTGAHRPTYAEVTVRKVADPVVAAQALSLGEAQVIAVAPNKAVADIVAGMSAESSSVGSADFEQLTLQLDESKSGALDDPLVREAFLLTLPRQEIVDTLVKPLSPDAEVRNSFVFTPGTADYVRSIAVNGSAAYAEPDPEAAKALLAEAGVVSPEVCVLYDPANASRAAAFSLIATAGAAGGFHVTDCSTDNWRELLGVPGAYDAAMFAWQPRRTGVTTGAPLTWGTGAVNNLSFYSNPTTDALIDDLAVAMTDAERTSALTEIDAQLWADVAGVPLYQFPRLTASDTSKVDGVDPSPLPPGAFWNVWQWEPAQP